MNGPLGRPSWNHTGLVVRDLAASVAFYTELFGYEVVYTGEGSRGFLPALLGYEDVHLRVAMLGAPGTDHRLELVEYVVPSGRPLAPERNDTGSPHLCFWVEDLERARDVLVGRGSVLISTPTYIDTGPLAGGWSMFARDPDGTAIELHQPAAPAVG